MYYFTLNSRTPFLMLHTSILEWTFEISTLLMEFLIRSCSDIGVEYDCIVIAPEHYRPRTRTASPTKTDPNF